MENELYHHGIKGMKWGVRRYQNKDGTLTNTGKKRRNKVQSANKVEKARRKADLKKRRTMSDADIKKRIERLKLEKQLKDLTEEDISPGKKFTSEVMLSAGKKALGVVAAGAMVYSVKVAMTRKFDIKEAAGYIAANPNKKK